MQACATAVMAGAKISAADYFNALRAREALQEEFAVAFRDFDAILTPTTQVAAIPVESVDQLRMPSHFTRFANFWNYAASPCRTALP